MTDEIVCSKILDKNIRKNLTTSPIWKDAHKVEELSNPKKYYKYHIRFNGLKPIQLLKVTKAKNSEN